MARVTSDRHVEYVDGLRGLAVLGVIGSHTLAGISNPIALDAVHIGERGVDLFFVISGFCLSRSSFVKARSGQHVGNVAAFLQFMVARCTRIAPPYLVALALFAALPFAGFGFPTSEHQPQPLSRAVWAEFARDAVFLTSPSPTHNSSFWTLGIEMRWYLLCPLILAVYRRTKVAFAIVAIALYAVYFSPWGIADAGTLPCFMLGVVAANIDASPCARFRTAAAMAAAVTLGAAILRQALVPVVDFGDPFWHAACFFVVVAVGGGGVLGRFAAGRILRALGVASYSIYLVHQPFLCWLIHHGVARGVAALASIACGFVFWFAVERRLSGSFRQSLTRRLRLALGIDGSRQQDIYVPLSSERADARARASSA